MSSTNIAEGDGERIDKGPQQQTSDQNDSEEQPTSSGVGAEINVKLTTVSEDSEKPIARSSSLTSLDELAARLKYQLNEDDLKRAINIKTNSILYAPENPSNLMKSESSKSLNELAERLNKLKNNEDPSSVTKMHTSISVVIASGSAKSKSNSKSSLLKEKERVEEKESFVTVEPCQKEKKIGTDTTTVFSSDNRTQNMIVVRSDYANQPPPPYEHTQRYDYRGNLGQTPVYQTQNVVRIYPISHIYLLKLKILCRNTGQECPVMRVGHHRIEEVIST